MISRLDPGTILGSGAGTFPMFLLRPAHLVLVTGLAWSAFGQTGRISIVGETTDGRTVQLPDASAGRYTIIAVAASRKAEPLLQEWYEPAYRRFVAKQGLFAGDREVDLWLVPVFTGLNKAAFGPSIKRLKAEADPDVASRVIFVKDDAGALLSDLAIKARDEPYFFVLAPDGRTLHREHGAFTVDKLDALEAAMDE